MARVASLASPNGICSMTSSVAGLTRSHVPPLDASTHLPLISCLKSIMPPTVSASAPSATRLQGFAGYGVFMSTSTLRPIERVVVRLRYDGASDQEIGTRIGKKPATVRRIFEMIDLREGHASPDGHR